MSIRMLMRVRFGSMSRMCRNEEKILGHNTQSTPNSRFYFHRHISFQWSYIGSLTPNAYQYPHLIAVDLVRQVDLSFRTPPPFGMPRGKAFFDTPHCCPIQHAFGKALGENRVYPALERYVNLK